MNDFNSNFNHSDSPGSEPLASNEPRVRGLPDHNARVELAETYVKLLHEYYPADTAPITLPDATSATYQRLAGQFRVWYTGGWASRPMPRLAGGWKVGVCYVRYSDDNSNSRSLDQQLRNVMAGAANGSIFVPWEYVLCDAGIPGTTSDRPGYRQLMDLVESDRRLDVVLVDDLSRLARNSADSNLFLAHVRYRQRQLRGVSDGFDSANQMADISHTFASLQHQMFSKDLSRKVQRGARDKFEQGGNPGAVATGYRVEPILDEAGNFVYGGYKRPRTRVVIDSVAADVIRRIYDMYALQKMSPARIARQLNSEAVLERNTWSQSSIARILKNERYRGVRVWGEYTYVRHPLTGKRSRVARDAEDVQTDHDESLRIITDEQWQAARRRERVVSVDTRGKNGRPVSQQSKYSKRLFDVICAHCDKPLRLWKSDEKSAVLHCDRGKHERNGCKLRSSKSVHIIDECILAVLKEQFLDEQRLDQLLVQANAFLAEEAAKPPVDTEQLDRNIRSLRERRKRLADRLATMDPGHAFDTVVVAIERLSDELQPLEAERQNATAEIVPTDPIERNTLQTLIDDLRTLLQEDVTAAADILKEALGEVYVTQGEKRGRSPSWWAELHINPVPVLLEIAQIKDLKDGPTTHALEYLRACSWTIDWTASCQVFEVKREHRIAQQAGELADAGCSFNLIKDVLNVDWHGAKAAVAFVKDHPDDARRLAEPRCLAGIPDYEQQAAVVAKMHQFCRLSFERIAELCNSDLGEVERLYKQGVARQQATSQKKKRRRITQEQITKIRELLLTGKYSHRQIAKRVGVTHGTVGYEKKKLNTELAQSDAA